MFIYKLNHWVVSLALAQGHLPYVAAELAATKAARTIRHFMVILGVNPQLIMMTWPAETELLYEEVDLGHRWPPTLYFVSMAQPV